MRKNLNKKKRAPNPNLLSHILIAFITCLLLVGIMQWDKGLFEAGFREGDIALRDVYAPYKFSVKGDIDILKTEEKKKEAISELLPVFIYDATLKVKPLEKITSFIKEIEALQKIDETLEEPKREVSKSEELERIATIYNFPLPLAKNIMEAKDVKVLVDKASIVMDEVMGKNIISNKDLTYLDREKTESIAIVNTDSKERNIVKISNLLLLDQMKEEIEKSMSLIKEKKDRQIARDLISATLIANTRYSKETTDAEKKSIVNEIEPVYKTIEVKKNELIINKGERIGKEHIAKLKGIQQNVSQATRLGGILAVIILVGLFMLLLSMYINIYDPEIIKGNKEMVLLATVCILTIMAAKVIVISPWPSNLIPVAVASMLIAILLNSRLALITTCFLSIIVGIISGSRLDITGVSLVGGVIGIFAMKGVRRRSQVLQAGLSVGCANMSYFIAMGLIRALDFNTYIVESLFGLANGIMSAIIVTGVLPFFENAFKISTDISLLELSDLNHPLLKEMVIKAPGTYHHSLVVGNLAEAACEAIGANSLLARVGSYFHDIGKIDKSSYFSENQGMGSSNHDKLSPTMSSLIITKHVKNGVELASEYKLNRKIKDIINQHHGTGLVFYFFKRALEKKGDEDIGEESFRYPGPKPQTKEAACVLLADSVEAASRTLDEPTPSRIKGLVRKIINNKFIDGQLDECDLTLSDLERIAEVFTHILTGIFHTRVEYPDDTEMNTNSKNNSKK
ncbi:MAG: HDIG domain-containing metalloprotein [Candidatus Omnitrophota bacterium]